MKKRFMAIMLSAITMACSVSAVYAECAFSEWNGKNVSMELSQELSENGSEKIDILLDVSMDKNYVYNGKTWAEYIQDNDDNWVAAEKMHELVKTGDYMKYGEKLYTTGTPDGEKWSEAYYNEKVECYGEELLSKYIVNGEFLQDKLIADTEAFEKEYYKAYREAYTAVSQYSTENVYKELQQKDVDCDYDKDKNKLVIHMTADEFADLSIDNVSLYQLDLPVSDDGEPICAEAALYPVASPVDTVIVCGDANNDSAIDARDASAILIAYANSSSDAGYKLNYDDIQKMDADENNIVDSRDASFVLAYYAFTSANGKGTLKDYVKNIKKADANTEPANNDGKGTLKDYAKNIKKADANTEPANNESNDFEAQYYIPITWNWISSSEYPLTKIITSRTELDAYNYNYIEDKKKYTDDWFEEHNLLLVTLEEPSGSIRHRVTGVTKDKVSIERLLPSVQTCDMAAWQIVIELDKDSEVSDDFAIALTDVDVE